MVGVAFAAGGIVWWSVTRPTVPDGADGPAISIASCSYDPSHELIDTISTTGSIITVTQSATGALAGSLDPQRFAEVVMSCFEEIEGRGVDSLRQFQEKLQCEAWLHNLATWAATGQSDLQRKLQSISSVATLLAHGSPIDMDIRVWAGEVRGKPWDGYPSTCRAVSSAVDPFLERYRH